MRRIILTQAVLATIPEMVERHGMSAHEIAEKLGCKITTLKVRCSQARISLRPPGSRAGGSNSDERMSENSKELSAVNKTQSPTTCRQLRKISGEIASCEAEYLRFAREPMKKLAGGEGGVAGADDVGPFPDVVGRPMEPPSARCARSNNDATHPASVLVANCDAEKPAIKCILTKEVLASIPAMVARGQRAADIADALGCKLNTLKVRCSRARVSLRPPGSIRRPREQHSIKINKTALQLLKERAAASGKTESDMARELLEIIARDNLFDAVLDEAA